MPALNEDAREPDDPATLRPRLLGLAYRMLGSVADAEDAVQDAYLRFHQAGGEDAVAAPAGWLVRTTTRICIDRLRRDTRRRDYVGPWLPEPATPDWPGAVGSLPELAESLSMAFLVLLETLNPTERAAYLLREVFGYDFDEIASLLGKTATNVRQITSRARKRLDEPGRKPAPADPKAADDLAARFLAACRSGDLAAVEALLTPDVVVLSDGGGKVRAARRPITGRYRIAHFLVVTSRKRLARYALTPTRVNGQPGLVYHRDGQAAQVIALAIRDGQVAGLFSVLNPEKLRHWSDSLPPSDPEPPTETDR